MKKLYYLCFFLAVSGCAGLSSEQVTELSEAPAPQTVVAERKGEGLPPGTLYRLLSAEFAVHRGDTGYAIQTYSEVAREMLNSELAERATRIAVLTRDAKAGIDAAKLWVELADTTEAYRVYAVLLVRSGQTRLAFDVFSSIIKRFGKDEGKGFRLVADLLNRDRNKERRVEVMEEIVSLHGGAAHAKVALAQVAAAAGQGEKALAVMRAVHEAHPGEPEYAVFYASILRSQGNMDRALEVLKAQVERDSGERKVRMVFARFLVDAKRYEAAQQQFELLLKAFPDRSDVRYGLALLLLQTNHPDKARAHFERLWELKQYMPQVSFYLGRIAEAQEQPDEAIRFYRQVDRGDQYLNAQIRIAVIYSGMNELVRARQHLGAVRRENASDDVRLFRAEAELLSRSDRFDEAISVYDDALKAHPRNTDLLYARAMMAARAKRHARVESDLREILSREPNHAEALNALGYTLADRDDRLDEAYDLIKRALTLKPRDHYVIDSMGWVLYRLGRLEEAVVHLRKALEIQPDAEVAAHLGEVLWALGYKREARQVWNSALKETPEDAHLLETIERLSK